MNVCSFDNISFGLNQMLCIGEGKNLVIKYLFAYIMPPFSVSVSLCIRLSIYLPLSHTTHKYTYEHTHTPFYAYLNPKLFFVLPSQILFYYLIQNVFYYLISIRNVLPQYFSVTGHEISRFS